MSDDNFFDQLRRDARPLRFEPDGAMTTRIAARVRERIAQPVPTVYQFLAAWMRPLAASLAALVLTAFVGLAWTSRTQQESTAMEAMSPQVEIAMAGEQFGVSH
jgi:hypothetical protein